MIIGIIHKGSGLGDQLFSYIATRVRAADLGVDFGFVGKEFFKGASFMDLDWGEVTSHIKYHTEIPSGKLIIHDLPTILGNIQYEIFEINKPHYDPEFNFIPDGSVIDGYGAQDIKYFEHRLDEIRDWLAIRSNFSDYDHDGKVCVINFRGGEFKAVPELFLPKEYWDKAISLIKEKYRDKYLDRYQGIRFEVHTDDPETAKEFFPDFPIFSDIELNWRAIRHAKHLILSNSAFGILPALLNENAQEIIAPRYWNRRNVGRWDWPMNYYEKFQYI